jgi:hypothetical protein
MRISDGEFKFVKAIYSPESKKIIAALLDSYENAISLVEHGGRRLFQQRREKLFRKPRRLQGSLVHSKLKVFSGTLF